MSEYLFDPGYGRHLVSLIFSLEDMYRTINKFKNLGQKKFQFKQYYPSILKLLKQNTAFYLDIQPIAYNLNKMLYFVSIILR